MTSSDFDIVVVGAGAAGLTAAIGMARSGFHVAVVEAAAFPGAENWSGCVYFAENLAHPDILGPQGVEELAWERRLVERGFFATDGHGLLGMKYRDPAAFKNCYTVLRPIYDHHLAQFARRHGAHLLCSTTVESLLREDGRVIGVCTNRGPIHAKLTFLAEGDASHLVTREGYERGGDPRYKPKFLQGIKQVLELPPRAIEERFGVGAEEGAAYEMLLRNGTLNGKQVHLNMGGFVYTNRQSLSIGLVLPADNLHEHFEGDPNLLMEWFLRLPSLQPWFEGAVQGPFGAKIIRGGGIKDVPRLIDDGLAIGGAASAIGIDFPYPNFTGPASAMGLLITQAARHIREEGGDFGHDDLERHYLKPLQRSHYWQDVEYLRDWPGYVKKTLFFFGGNVDLALGSAYLWTRPGKGTAERCRDWLHLVDDLTSNARRAEVEDDLRQFTGALRVRDAVNRPSLWRLLLDGTLNSARDLVGRSRPLPPHGNVTLHYSLGGGAEPGGLLPPALRRLFERYASALASAARVVYNNDATPLAKKLPEATRLLTRHVSLLDFASALKLGLTAATQRVFGKRGNELASEAYFSAARIASDLTPAAANGTAAWEARLAQLSYDTVKASHIHIHWPHSLATKNDITKAGLWHVCPAHVYEARVSAAGQLQVVVNFENCIKCETCWRTSDIVDWARDGAHQFVYAVHSPVVTKLLASMEEPPAPISISASRERKRPEELPGIDPLLHKLEQKLIGFDEHLAEEPRTIGQDRAEYLQMLAHYAHQIALQLSFTSDPERQSFSRDPERSAGERVTRILADLQAHTQRRIEHAQAGRYSWAAADGRQIRLQYLPLLAGDAAQQKLALDSTAAGSLSAISPPAGPFWPELRKQLDSALQPGIWRDLELGKPLTSESASALRSVITSIRSRGNGRPGDFVFRKRVLSQLAKVDPSLAYRVASHLWACDLAKLAGAEQAERWESLQEWACAVVLDERRVGLLFPGAHAKAMFLVNGPRLQICSPDAPGLTMVPLATLGLRGAGNARLRLADGFRPDSERCGEEAAFRGAWELNSAYDVIAMAHGVADYLCCRAIDHAANRVQFPGLFLDEESHDAIGKFGAVKKMIAEMAAGREMIRRCLPAFEVKDANVVRVTAMKAVVAEVLGTAPGSIAYNAGQVFGGTGYSEDDTLSKLYRDSAAFRFLGVPNSEAFARHGSALIQFWTPGGEMLSQLCDESSIFSVIEQRQALAGELAVIRTHAAKVTEIINRWKFADDTLPTKNARAAFTESVGRQDALLLASKYLLAWTHRSLEGSCGSETDIALLRTWLNKVRLEFDSFEIHLRTLRSSPVAYAPGSPMAVTGSPVTQYAEMLNSDLPYSSGDFLSAATDPMRPRYVPEMIETDEFLSKRNKELIEMINQQFGQPRGGKVYERYLEDQHRPDAADLDFLRDHGFFRMPIPKELGGEARSKADYYLLTVNTHRLADASISLTIQVCSSLGTTPVLLARDKDLPKAIKDAKDANFRDELKRRREACDLFCRWVASGQISAFALTEPSAGSDTARVATRAKLREVTALPQEYGVFKFMPQGGKQPRIVLDSRRLDFTANRQAAYRFSDADPPAPICFDEYDYETDGSKKRYFVAGGRKVYFDDIATLRQRDGKLWYHYWELTGAKMWITNGRVMGLMALYAKTDKGVTGFMVDRHAEGLIVGKDEAKMGQNGSPTNELSLQSVRVPRENVLGLEGRGQVNALETLNVGRAGLAMSAMCQMIRLCQWSRAFAKERYGDMPPWIGWRLDRMEEERFIAEAMSYEVIGRFEHKKTKSIRMESAIAKMLVSELFHHSIELAEEIHGLEGQTQDHLVEKRKRDARILNIYEGTNEIQRFLILKELTEIAATFPGRERQRPEDNAIPELRSLTLPARHIDELKASLRELTTEAVKHFGQQLWQNPNLQARCFVLSEMAAWIMAAESTLGRLTWLQRKGDATEELTAAGARALARCQGEVETRLARFREDLDDLKRGRYGPEVRAATLLFQQKEPHTPPTANRVAKPMAILVILDPPSPAVPRPRTQDGCLLEPYRVLSDADRAALETALLIRDAATNGCPVSVQVIGAAQPSAAADLCEAVSLGADRVRLVTTGSPVSPDRAAAALAHVLRGEPGFDLVLGGAGAADSQQGLVARLTAETLGLPFAGSAANLAISTDQALARLIGSDGQSRARPLPAAAMIEPGVKLRAFTIEGWMRGLEKPVELIAWPSEISACPIEFEEAAVTTPTGEKPPQPLLPREASRLVLETAGMEMAGPASRAAKTTDSTPMPAISPVVAPFFAAPGAGPQIVAVLAADADGKLRPTARRTLEAAQFLTPFFQGAAKTALVLVPPQEAAQRRAAAEIMALSPHDICLLVAAGAANSDEVCCRLLAECWSGLESFPAAVVGEPWAESALATLATASGKVDPIALRVRLLDRHHGKLVTEGLSAKGKLRTRQSLLEKKPDPFSTVWLGLTAEAEIGAATPETARADRRVERWTPSFERFFGRDDMRRLLQELKQDTGLVRLSDAEFIIDVGFGVVNRDGYEAVIQPLENELRRLGVRGLTIGGSRKVTEELRLLPPDRQIGQSGVSVNPRVLLAVGVSGAPQHLNYIGQRATIVAFNRDPEAPLLTLNQRQARPRVFPVIGDLFETVPALVACLQEEAAADGKG